MSTATISDCGLYRYTLSRRTAGGLGMVLFLGVNPSTADAVTNDATARKWMGFTARWGYAGFYAGNLFAYRATDVTTLARVADPVGPYNNRHLLQLIANASLIVPCWGSRAKLPPSLRPRILEVRKLLRDSERPCKVLGLTASGDPKHPLMLGYDTNLIDWSP